MKAIIILTALFASYSLVRAGELAELHKKLAKSSSNPFHALGNSSTVSTNHGISEIGIERAREWLGAYPTYTFIVKSDGTFRYKGDGSAKHVGNYTGRIHNLGLFHKLAEVIKEAGFVDFEDSYDFAIDHASSVYTMIVINGKQKVVKNRADSGPAKLWAVERLIDSVMADVQHWQKEQ